MKIVLNKKIKILQRILTQLIRIPNKQHQIKAKLKNPSQIITTKMFIKPLQEMLLVDQLL
jgi:hypothetical protein